ncbi:MAG: oligopeptide transporter, OPT family [Bdellovibrionota bacterium]
MKSKSAKNPELNPTVIGIGILLGVLLTAANVYLGLYAGMTVAASIPAAVISMAIYSGILKKKNAVLESNIVQTMASAGESLAAGIIFTVPALVIIGTWNEFKFWPTTLIAISGGLLGILFMIPLRKALITENKELQYPEGIACAAVLKSGDSSANKNSFAQIVRGFIVGASFKFLASALAVFKGTVEYAHRIGDRNFYIGSDVSPALVAVGYIVNWQNRYPHDHRRSYRLDGRNSPIRQPRGSSQR